MLKQEYVKNTYLILSNNIFSSCERKCKVYSFLLRANPKVKDLIEDHEHYDDLDALLEKVKFILCLCGLLLN